MRGRDLRYVLAVAEELHFARAADRLSIAPSALSRAVGRTETELGVQLFVRDAHGVTLSEAGAVLVDRAREALASLDEALALAQEAGLKPLRGALEVGINPMLRNRLGPTIFARFAQSYPAVRVVWREQLSGPLIEELLARRIDVALDFCPASRHELSYKPICDAALVVLVCESHPFARRGSVNLFELRDELFLLPRRESAPAMRPQLVRLFAAAGFQARCSSAELDHDQQMLAVKRGSGVALVSRFFLQDSPPEIAVLELDPPVRLSFELVCRAERPAPALARLIGTVDELASRELGA
jgi:DNA-binding transcriptional LysR family regulator